MELTSLRYKMGQVRELEKRGIIKFEFENLLEHVYRKLLKEGDTVIDIGAHTGRHLRPILEIIGASGKAIAFEPLPFAYAALLETINSENLQLHNVALSNKTGDFEFIHATGSPEESGLLQRNYNNPEIAQPRAITVSVKKLDEYTTELQTLNYIKIDIEGAEIDCLKGAKDALTRLRPIISVEYGSPSFSVYGNKPETLFHLAKENNYVLYDIFLNRLGDIESWVGAVDFMCWDFIMVPAEKTNWFSSLTNAQNEFDSDAIDYIKEYSNVAAENETLRKRIHDLENSTSWKITAPIRKIVSILR